MDLARITELPAQLDDLLAESVAQGHGFLERLIGEFESGANRFDESGERLFAVYESGTLIAVGGLSADPYIDDPTVGRVRSVYVRSGWRGAGVGKMLVGEIITEAARAFQLLTLRARTPAAARFYEGMGFRRDLAGEHSTHGMRLTAS